MQFALWQIAPAKILTRQELGLVLVDLKHFGLSAHCR